MLNTEKIDELHHWINERYMAVLIIPLKSIVNHNSIDHIFIIIQSYICIMLNTEEDHEKIDELHHWINERYVAVLLIPAIPAALIYPNIITDTVLVTAMCLHTYW